jgi:hypothetical protein
MSCFLYYCDGWNFVSYCEVRISVPECWIRDMWIGKLFLSDGFISLVNRSFVFLTEFCAHCWFCIILGSPFFPQSLPKTAVLLIYVREVTVQISRRSTTTLTAYHRVLSQSLPTPDISKINSIAKLHVFLTVHLVTSVCKENQLDALFILSLFRQSTSTCFGHICSPSTRCILYIYIYIYKTIGRCCDPYFKV